MVTRKSIKQEGYLDLKGLSEYSSLSVRTLRNYLGKVPYYKVGGKLLIKKAEFDRFIEQHRVADNLDEVVDNIVDGIRTRN